jgi:hypothetical protein
VNTAQIAAAAIPSALVLSSGIVTCGLRSAVRKGATVAVGLTFKVTPPAPPKAGTAQPAAAEAGKPAEPPADPAPAWTAPARKAAA